MVTLYLARFLGTEHAVALDPNRLQDRCEGQAASSDCKLQPGSTLHAINCCPLADGHVDRSIREARSVGPPIILSSLSQFRQRPSAPFVRV